MVDSANALLNYIPIFLIFFSFIAILEDSGYMARIAFILDKLFHFLKQELIFFSIPNNLTNHE